MDRRPGCARRSWRSNWRLTKNISPGWNVDPARGRERQPLPDGRAGERRRCHCCGMEAAQEVMDEWQNQFNSEIIQVANQTGVPAQLMKNIFSRESQFWPGIYQRVYEAGLDT